MLLTIDVVGNNLGVIQSPTSVHCVCHCEKASESEFRGIRGRNTQTFPCFSDLKRACRHAASPTTVEDGPISRVRRVNGTMIAIEGVGSASLDEIETETAERGRDPAESTWINLPTAGKLCPGPWSVKHFHFIQIHVLLAKAFIGRLATCDYFHEMI